MAPLSALTSSHGSRLVHVAVFGLLVVCPVRMVVVGFPCVT